MRFMKAGATSQSIYLEVLDSTSTTGGRKTGLAYNTSSLTAYYVRNGGSATAITLATLAAANSAYSSGGFKEVDATNMPGVYRLDLPDAAVASGATSVVVTLKGATGMVQVSAEIQLVTFDPQDSVRMGMTALPNAAAEAAGGLFTRGTGAGQINQETNGRIDVNLKAAAGTNVTLDANNVLNVSTKYLGGTLLTARDIGASVLLSSGTGTGQLDFTSGVLKGNLVQINGTSIAGTGTRVADSFVAFLNVASPVLTVASVNQTGDSYAIVNNGTYGNAAIRTRGDSAWATATGFSTHSAADVWSVATRTLTAGTNIQLPANGLASVTAWTVDITGSLSGSVGSVAGAVGSVTGNVGGNVSGNVVGSVGSLATQAKADVNAEVDAALVDIGLDHLLAASVTGTDVTDNSIIAKLVSKSATADWDSYTNTTDALEAIRDRGDTAWTTATGFSTHSAADVWSVGTRALTDKAGFSISGTTTTLDALQTALNSAHGAGSWATATGFSTLDAAGVRTAVGLASANLDTQLTAIDDYLDTEIAAIKAKTDQLTFTVANQVDANSLSGGGGLDAAGVRAAVGLASANLDTQLAAIDDYIDTEVAAIKAKTDNLPASPAATGDIPSAATVASAVRTELATELGRIDAAISTRQISIWSSASATVNLSGTTVKAVTDAVSADVTKIDGNTSAAQLLSLSARTMHSGTVTGSPTTTSFVDSATSSYAETDQFKGRIIIFYNAEHIVKEATNITAYDPGTNAFTFSALSRAPTVGDAYVIV